jgi:hypothetical protein
MRLSAEEPLRRFCRSLYLFLRSLVVQNGSYGFAASHPVKPGSGTDNTFWTLVMFNDVSRARGGPGKFAAKPGVIFGLSCGQRAAMSWPICQRESFSAPAT